MDALTNLIADTLSRVVTLLKGDQSTLAILIFLALVAILLIFFLIYIISVHKYLTDSEAFFKRQMKKMVKAGVVDSKDLNLIPVIQGKKKIIPIEPDELLHFFLPCEYWFFKLSDQMKNVNSDIIFSEKEAIKDFETVGRGKAFFTSKSLLFENIRSRNIIAWAHVFELKVKYGYLLIIDKDGCHAFRLETPGIVSEFIYHTFLKET